MAHYVCNRCNAVFSEDEAATESFRHTEVRPTYTENFLACPACLSTDYDDAAYCYRCKQPVRYSELLGGYYCKSCMSDIRNRFSDNSYINENLNDYAEWLHERRAKNNADEQDAIDIMRGVRT